MKRRTKQTIGWLVGAMLLAALVAVISNPEILTWDFAHLLDAGGFGILAVAPAGVHFGELKTLLTDSSNTISRIATDTERRVKDMDTKLAGFEKQFDKRGTQLDELSKSFYGRSAGLAAKGPNDVVSEGCAHWLHGLWVQAGLIQGKLNSHPQLEEHMRLAGQSLGIQQRTALTTTDVPMPTNYGKEIVELVWAYGQFRKYTTYLPLGTLTTQLPKLKTSPAFGFIDMSTAVPEKSPQIQFVSFVALKAGGIVRVPSEIDADSAPSIGQFLARYIAREMAKWEDTCGFLADGSGTYKTRSGVAKTADTLTFKVQLTAGNSNASTITIANMRAIRAKVDAAALGTSAYYMHPTMEAHLSSFNTSTFVPYQASGPNGPTFEGFPIRWIGVMPIYETTTRLNQYQVLFGDLSYWYLGDRGAVDIQISRDVFFTTDEIALRALERFDFQLMADAAMSVLQLAAS